LENALDKSNKKKKISCKIDRIDKILEDEISNKIDLQIPKIEIISKL